MTNRPCKQVKDSYTETVHLVRNVHINGVGRLYGGQLVSWIDEVATTVAKRHCETNVTTASIDNLIFKKAATLDNLIVIEGRLTYVGNSSLEVRVDSYLEIPSGYRYAINRAYLTFVSLNERDEPIPIRYDLEVLTESEKAEYENAKKRMELRKERRKEGY